MGWDGMGKEKGKPSNQNINPLPLGPFDLSIDFWGRGSLEALKYCTDVEVATITNHHLNTISVTMGISHFSRIPTLQFHSPAEVLVESERVRNNIKNAVITNLLRHPTSPMSCLFHVHIYLPSYESRRVDS